MRRPRQVAGQIAARHHLSGLVSPLSGPGGVNHVFLATSSAARAVIRFPADPLRPDEFEVEQWCLRMAEQAGIGSPHVLARGRLGDVPYLIHTFVVAAEGEPGPSPYLWRTLGSLARTIQRIEITPDAPDGLFSRFGRDLPAAWTQHLSYNLDQLSPRDPLLQLGVYRSDRQGPIRSRLRRLSGIRWTFGLRHGDLAPRNLLLADDGSPVLLDWGAASAGIVPYGELLVLMKAHRLTGEPTAGELDAFAAEVGVSLADDAELVEDLLLLDAMDLVRWARDKRPDRLDEVVGASTATVAHALG